MIAKLYSHSSYFSRSIKNYNIMVKNFIKTKMKTTKNIENPKDDKKWSKNKLGKDPRTEWKRKSIKKRKKNKKIWLKK